MKKFILGTIALATVSAIGIGFSKFLGSFEERDNDFDEDETFDCNCGSFTCHNCNEEYYAKDESFNHDSFINQPEEDFMNLPEDIVFEGISDENEGNDWGSFELVCRCTRNDAIRSILDSKLNNYSLKELSDFDERTLAFEYLFLQEVDK